MALNICILHVYWGVFPNWFPYFLKSCELNDTIQFLILSDNDISFLNKKNIKYKKFLMPDFNQLASEKLGITINIEIPYKICDFKPAFGKIFEDYLCSYDYWGYCDNDMVFGNISQFLNRIDIKKYDIISFYRGFLSGPFCIYRNSKIVVELFMDGGEYQNIFLAGNRNLGFDENIERLNLHGFKFSKVLSCIFFLFSELFRGNLTYSSVEELRYQFQWYFKKRYLGDKNPLNMTEIVWKAQKIKRINPMFSEYLLSDSHYYRNGRNTWKIKWENGSLFDLKRNQEIFAYHFINSKTTCLFSISNSMTDSIFHISQDGITN